LHFAAPHCGRSWPESTASACLARFDRFRHRPPVPDPFDAVAESRHRPGSWRLEFSAAYTFSKSMDQSSNIGEEVNPFNPALSYSLSAFDVKHNFVVSYEYQLTFDRWFHSSRLTNGWALSGITLRQRFSRGHDRQRRQLADRDQS
jgi:hypothetical protein